MAPEMPSARYSFGATVWPELPTWRSIGSQPASQIGRDAASSAPSAVGQLLRRRGRCSCPLMPRPTATMRSACDRSTACFASWNGASGFWRIAAASIVDRQRRDRRRRAAPRRLIGPERADLERDEVRRRALRHDVGGQLALEHRPDERRSSPPLP